PLGWRIAALHAARYTGVEDVTASWPRGDSYERLGASGIELAQCPTEHGDCAEVISAVPRDEDVVVIAGGRSGDDQGMTGLVVRGEPDLIDPAVANGQRTKLVGAV